MALVPTRFSSLREKFDTNAVALDDDDDDDDDDGGSGLFLNCSRVNHDCIGNSSHYYVPELKLKFIAANHDIPAGSDVTFSYASSVPSFQRGMILRARGVQCTCSAWEL